MTLYEIGEGVNMIRVRAQDASTELYDLAPAEVTWIRDATPPKMEWEWTPEEVTWAPAGRKKMGVGRVWRGLEGVEV